MAPYAVEPRKRIDVFMTRQDVPPANKAFLEDDYEAVSPNNPVPLEAMGESDGRKRRRRESSASGSYASAEGELPSRKSFNLNGPANHFQDLKNAGESSTSLTHVERSSMQQQIEGELEALRYLQRFIDLREDYIHRISQRAPSESAEESRRRPRRSETGAMELSSAGQGGFDGGLGDTGQSGTCTPSAGQANRAFSREASFGKRTPKANSAYINSDFLSARDKMPPPEKLKPKALQKRLQGKAAVDDKDPRKLKIEAMRQRKIGEALRQCAGALKKAMTHKYSWVFMEPVDAVKLGLHDYHTIIKHPMDLGTVNGRLKASAYKSPDELYADVDLVWSNAMTYNPPGHDVHMMALELKKIFDEQFNKVRLKMDEDARKLAEEEQKLFATAAQARPYVEELERRLQLLESQVVAAKAAPRSAPAKPKAAEAKKRDMTYEEKQRLSVNLGKLPAEKLERVLQIISERNPNLSQNDDEIELDIDSLDQQTLWELDRYVTNCMKSKNKPKKKPQAAPPPPQVGGPSLPSQHVAWCTLLTGVPSWCFCLNLAGISPTATT